MKRLQLTARTVDKATKRGFYGDGSGLWLQISKYGTKSWVFRYTLHGRRREMGIGPVDTFSLKEAREKARDARQQIKSGIDPIDARRAKKDAARAAAVGNITFKEAALLYQKDKGGGWRSDRHRRQWLLSLEQHAFGAIGNLPVNTIELPHVLRVLSPIWQEKTETASRVRARIERVLGWCTVRKYRSGDNPARWDGHLSELLDSRHKLQPVKHLPALPFEQLPAFMADLRQREDARARALELCILTAARTAEVIGATWDEIDLGAKTWTVPDARAKSGRPHRVPLCDRAIELLGEQRAGKRLFNISNNAMLRLLRVMGHATLTVHGFRSTFSDWARDRTAYPRDVIEMALAHAIRDKSEAAYRRGDALEKRRRLMAEWGRYCCSPSVAGGEVVSLHGAA